jgi:hypothetical protein
MTQPRRKNAAVPSPSDRPELASRRSPGMLTCLARPLPCCAARPGRRAVRHGHQRLLLPRCVQAAGLSPLLLCDSRAPARNLHLHLHACTCTCTCLLTRLHLHAHHLHNAVAKTQKSVPLGKIQDVELVENCVLTCFGLKQVRCSCALWGLRSSAATRTRQPAPSPSAAASAGGPRLSASTRAAARRSTSRPLARAPSAPRCRRRS